MSSSAWRSSAHLQAPAWWDRRSAQRLAVITWSTLWLFSLQLGPVYTLRVRAAPLVVDFTDDLFVGLWFVVLTGAGIVLQRWCGRPLQLGRVGRLVVAWWGVLAVSTLWSVDRVRTFDQMILLLGTLLAARAGVAILTRTELLVTLWASSQLGAVVAYRAVTAKWVGSIDDYGSWTGIYFNRNSLGPVASVGLLTTAWLIVPIARRLRRRGGGPLALGASVAGAIASIPLAVIDVRLLRGSGSATSIVAAAAATAAVVVAVGVRRVTGARSLRARSTLLASVLAVGSAVGATTMWTVLPRVFGKSSDYNRRGEIWRLVLRAIRVHPVRGWGWTAAWTDPGFMDRVFTTLGQPIGSAHNGLLEVVLGAGVLGGALAAVMIIAVVGRVITDVHREGPLPWLPLGLVTYALMMNVMESFLVADVQPLALLMLGAGLAAAPATSPRTAPHGDDEAGAPQLGRQ